MRHLDAQHISISIPIHPIMQKAVEMVAELMALSARTAPKGVGQDFLEITVACGADKDAIAEEMFKISKEWNNPGFTRDGNNVKDSDAVVLVGLLEHPAIGLDCGACGCEKCADFSYGSQKGDFTGPNCALRLLDMGIAIGSAVKTASMHNVDNRVMYRAGVAAKRLGLAKAGYVMGIPLSAKGKSPYFDR